jgi:hypothetical protein
VLRGPNRLDNLVTLKSPGRAIVWLLLVRTMQGVLSQEKTSWTSSGLSGELWMGSLKRDTPQAGRIVLDERGDHYGMPRRRYQRLVDL